MTCDSTLTLKYGSHVYSTASDSRRCLFAGWIISVAMFLALASSINVDSASIYMDKGTRRFPMAKGSLTQDILA